MNKPKNSNYKNKLSLVGQMSVVKVYTKIDSQRETILKENKNKAGIYKWINNQTGKFYIGSSVNLYKRFLFYLNIKSIHRYKSKSIIYSSLSKYGYKNFTLEIIEYCDIKETIVREQYYIDTYKPKYNILNLAASSLGFKHSDLTKIQMSLNNTKDKNPLFGKKHTEQSKIKMSLFSKKSFSCYIRRSQYGCN
jgi:group I intron endonuclease